ncbi:MAG: NAD(+) diphosphatase [Actinobacteria bacterium]|nr:MAG: NAD(+) diphosphatase [Actinomycetota bacterium]
MTGRSEAIVPPTPPFGWTRLRRAAHRRTDGAWLADAWPRSRVLVVDRDTALVSDDGLVLVDPDKAPDGERIFLGEDDEETPYFAVLAPLPELPGTRAVTIREIGHELNDLESALLVTAIALANWHRRHRYSPHDGKPTAMAEAGWARTGDDGRLVWPRTDPAVIVLVHDGRSGEGGRCLLGHNVAWTSPAWQRRYSCFAGFIEAGESAESAVVREVAEEAGITVDHLRYLGSQAWPYPGSLMLGFTARADPDRPVRVDATEISEARWFTRTEIRDVLTGDRDDFGLPMGASIAHFLITEWVAGRA